MKDKININEEIIDLYTDLDDNLPNETMRTIDRLIMLERQKTAKIIKWDMDSTFIPIMSDKQLDEWNNYWKKYGVIQ